MEETLATRYWCHMCSQTVNPITEVELECPLCRSGFVEEMANARTGEDNQDVLPELGSDRTISLWAPILLEMMGNPHGRRRLRRPDFEEAEVVNERDDLNGHRHIHREDREPLDQELDSRRLRRSSASILQLLQAIRAGIASEMENPEGDRNRERVILINPFSQTIIVQGSYDSSHSRGENRNSAGSIGDYIIGPGLDMLLHHLAENDPNRYGTPPAQKEAVEAMPTVKVKDDEQCHVCLDDFEKEAEAKEMPCKHKFHESCILPWLELHSSCPVCRFQLPAEESKQAPGGSQNASIRRESLRGRRSGDDGDGDGRNGNGRRFSIPWPFNGLFSSPSSSASSSYNAPRGNSPTDDSGT